MARASFGTCWFPSFVSAATYYASQGFTPSDVRQKRKDGEIHIGNPPKFENETSRWIEDHRWHIEVSK
jgi:hypothetical protein